MPEKLYRFLLQLFPSRFRAQYADEAMQLFRDRLREERGVLKRTRLWMDLLLDLSVSAAREHRRPVSHPAPSPSGVPSFLVLEEKPLRPDTFLFGTVLALLAIGAFAFLLAHGGNRVLMPALTNRPMRSTVGSAVGTDRVASQTPAPSAAESTPVPLVTPAEQRLVIRRVAQAIQEYEQDSP